MDNPLGLNPADGFQIAYNVPGASEALRASADPRGIPIEAAIGNAPGRLADWKLLSNIVAARKRGWPMIRLNEFVGETLLICGGGPSIKRASQLRELRTLQKKGGKVWAVNRTHDWLFTKGIKPWAGALLDPIPHVAKYIYPRPSIRYYIGSQCDPATFDVFDKPELTKFLYHARSGKKEERVIPPEEIRFAVPSKTSTIGLRSIVLGQMLGFRHFHLFGFDSSYEMDEKGEPIPKLHAYEKPEAICDLKKLTWVDRNNVDHTFYSNSAMAAQGNEFKNLMFTLAQGIEKGLCAPVFVYVHGDGLIPKIASDLNLHFDSKRNACNQPQPETQPEPPEEPENVELLHAGHERPEIAGERLGAAHG